MNGKELSKENKVVFVSEDGVKFQVYVDGKALNATKGLRITAGVDEEVEITPTLVALNDLDTFK